MGSWHRFGFRSLSHLLHSLVSDHITKLYFIEIGRGSPTLGVIVSSECNIATPARGTSEASDALIHVALGCAIENVGVHTNTRNFNATNSVIIIHFRYTVVCGRACKGAAPDGLHASRERTGCNHTWLVDGGANNSCHLSGGCEHISNSALIIASS